MPTSLSKYSTLKPIPRKKLESRFAINKRKDHSTWLRLRAEKHDAALAQVKKTKAKKKHKHSPTFFPRVTTLAGGRKVGTGKKYKMQDLVDAIHQVEEDFDETLLYHFVTKAYKDKTVLINLMKKLLPDLKHVAADIDVTEQFQLIIDATGTDEEDDILDLPALPAPQKRKPKMKRKKIT